ncbi:caspase domain-containing protein [Flammula alnicola]|nr:caspase domain-containing protein [Flammula alnicola]
MASTCCMVPKLLCSPLSLWITLCIYCVYGEKPFEKLSLNNPGSGGPVISPPGATSLPTVLSLVGSTNGNGHGDGTGGGQGSVNSESATGPVKIPESYPPKGPGPGVPRIFALVIGIDTYPNLSRLRGAVNDALAMVAFLRSHLRVPKDRVRILLNEQVTRHAIIEAFRELESNSAIESGDPILIFYAGHGVSMPAPPGWEDGGGHSKIQGIAPYDYASDAFAIPDRTIGALITLIANEKGDNITAIFDCCHAFSVTRAVDNVRGVTLEDEIPHISKSGKGRYGFIYGYHVPNLLTIQTCSHGIGNLQNAIYVYRYWLIVPRIVKLTLLVMIPKPHTGLHSIITLQKLAITPSLMLEMTRLT